MSKKKQRNAFYYFMLDMKDELRREGRNVSIAQMSILAGPRWSKLSDAEKAPYTLRAKQEKRNAGTVPELSHSGPGKMDSMGELLSERRDVVAEVQERRRRQAEDLKSFLSSSRDVIHQTVYFIDIQPQCELKELKTERWLPCEIAICAYSLLRGIRKIFHSYVHPGPIPMGYRYEAQSQSERTHMLPVDGISQSNKDYLNILMQIQSFISSFQESASVMKPLIFAKRDFTERVEFLLHWLAEKAGVELFIDQVYELELFLLRLDALSNPNGITSMTVFQASELLNTSSYDYERNLRCLWHEEKENKFCSQSIVNIYSFVISDNLCSKYSVSITPAHLPEQPDLPAGIVISSSEVPRLNTPRGVVTEVAVPMVLGRGRGRGLSGKALPTIRQPKCASKD